MAKQWNSVIARQAVVFRGTSTVGVLQGNSTFPQVRSMLNSAYGVAVTGGVSGTFGVVVYGIVGTTLYPLAGLTNITAAGNFILQPIGYSNTNGSPITMPLAAGVAVDSIFRLDQNVPPSQVRFEASVGTAGISANCTVGVCLLAE